MEIGLIGLGKMGGNMATRLLRGGHKVVAYDRSAEAVQQQVSQGAVGATSLKDFVSKLSAPRVAWVMLPDGAPTENTIKELSELLSANDIIIDGGNSKHTDDVRRAPELAKKGLRYVDVGTSGGIWGLKLGYCMMVGGKKEDVDALKPILDTLAPTANEWGPGWGHMGPNGAGHFVKMVHNGVEYAIMQAYAEGFEIMKASPYQLNLAQISRLWMNGSVVRSWLLELAGNALTENVELTGIKPFVNDSGEGRWTVEAAVAYAVPAPTITASLFERFGSRQTDSYSMKFLNALRNQFGGHTVVK